MGKIVFLTTELHPETAGGAGVVVDSLSKSLAERRGCIVVLMSSRSVELVGDRPGVEVVVAPLPDYGFVDRAQAAANALAEVVEPGDRIEVQDFEGLGFWALSHRLALGLDHALFTVRFHGPYELMAEAMETVPSDWALPIAMEREVFAMADQVLVPTPGFVTVLTEQYGVEVDRIAVSPPPVPPLPQVNLEPAWPPVLAVVGRLGEMKGSVEMVEASLELLQRGHDLRVRFIGEDGWSPTTSAWMRDRLEKLIPPRHRDSFEFTGRIERGSLPATLHDVTAVVVPSRFESFNLAANEARSIGLPVVVPDLPAFAGVFDEATGAVVYDRTSRDLTESLQTLIEDDHLLARLRSAPPPPLPDPLSAYATDPAPRHPRSQAGLGTVAVKNLEAAERAQHSDDNLLQRLYRLIPTGAAPLLARVTPRWVKDRLAQKASWTAEASRREGEGKRRADEASVAEARRARLQAIEDDIAAGSYPDIDRPLVSVVVPVFDDTRYLPETLASVYEQTHDSWEIVVVDDGSTDPEAVRYLDNLGRPRLRLIRQENRGLPAARNAGVSAARGEFVIPLDADDELDPEFMEKMIAALESHPRAAYAHCYARLFDEVDAIWLTRPFNPYWQLLGNGVVGCVLLRKAAWEEVGGYDETMTRGNEDWELWLRLMAAGWDQITVDQVLFRYRKHGVSMSVMTEARFEEGRRMVRDRHPDLYSPSHLEKAKSIWYPLITAVTNAAVPPLEGDAESITKEGDLAETWGKYVIDLRGVVLEDPAILTRMADALEAQPKRARCLTTGEPPLTMTRRWNLHDPNASPSGDLSLDASQPGGSARLPEYIPRRGWSMPGHIEPGWLPVQRQRPEEKGTLPDPSRW